MIHYETLYVLHPVHAARNQELKERFESVLTSQGAEITHFEDWGLRDLAYPIQKQGKGYYNLIQFKASPGATQELERIMRLAEEVMRCLTVALDEDVRPLGGERKSEPDVPREESPEQAASAGKEGEGAANPEAAPKTESDTQARPETTDSSQP